jgi:hypothetical protein
MSYRAGFSGPVTGNESDTSTPLETASSDGFATFGRPDAPAGGSWSPLVKSVVTLGPPKKTKVRQLDTVARGSELAQCDVFGGLTDLKGSPDPLEPLI